MSFYPHANIPTQVDLLVIGGGVNGAAVARDAAGRGASVLLCEQGDLASGTSSASSKLIHGGLRYLEHGHLRLVRMALRERTLWLRNAPHLVRPLRLIIPPPPQGGRASWQIRLGLWLYDCLASALSPLPGRETIDLSPENLYGAPLHTLKDKGFAFSDAWTDDARLVVTLAVDAAARGAYINPQTRVTSARREGKSWIVSVTQQHVAQTQNIRAQILVNAAGPWAGQVQQRILGNPTPPPLRLVKGSHIIVPRLYYGQHAYLLQNYDQRVIFVVPYKNDFTLIGTTDIAYYGDIREIKISFDEVSYLCRAVGQYFHSPPTPEQVVHSFSGLRPLYDDGQHNPAHVSRDYVLSLDAPPQQAPLLHIFGGKLTTARALAEQVVDQLAKFMPVLRPPWTESALLPGGNFPARGGEAEFLAACRCRFPQLPPELLTRWGHCYGSRMIDLIGSATTVADLGESFGHGLYAQEVRWLIREEFATGSEDVLWRRTGLGLTAPETTRVHLDAWFAARTHG